MSKQEELFNEIILLKHDIQRMASIVQNEDVVISDEEITEWNEDVNKLISKINSLKLDVKDFYGKY